MLSLRRSFVPLLLVALLSLARPAAARDSENAVYVGEVNLGASALDPKAKGVEPLAVLFHDERSPDGGSRQDTLSIFYAGRNYVGSQITLSSTLKVTLKNVEAPHDVLFRGTFQMLQDSETAILAGEFTSGDKETHHIHVKLKGYLVPYSAVPTTN